MTSTINSVSGNIAARIVLKLHNVSPSVVWPTCEAIHVYAGGLGGDMSTLSNLYDCKIEIGGIKFKSVQTWYELSRAKYYDDEVNAENMGKWSFKSCNAEWLGAGVRIDVTKDFGSLAVEKINSQARIVYHGNDCIWGIGDGNGLNLMGLILELVRFQLLGGGCDFREALSLVYRNRISEEDFKSGYKFAKNAPRSGWGVKEQTQEEWEEEVKAELEHIKVQKATGTGGERLDEHHLS
ncbi:hypothetical protein IFR05_000095 [Cadophora sp. M221]|nr:hypothetical protein IFR05_000095 [Cadophora sp. M221]